MINKTAVNGKEPRRGEILIIACKRSAARGHGIIPCMSRGLMVAFQVTGSAPRETSFTK
jgi:hypothetical protein